MSSKTLPSLAIICPCLNEEEIIADSLKKLLYKIKDLSDKKLIDFNYSKIILVDDGSTDRSWEILKECNKFEPKYTGIKLSRNFGHQNALLSGILTTSEDLIITIDLDLQDDLNVIDDMIKNYLKGYEIVYGIKSNRSANPFKKNFFADSFYFLLSLMGAKVIRNHADFRMLSKKAVQALREFKEYNLYLRGIIPLLGFKSKNIEYTLKQRSSGNPSYTFKKSFSLAIHGVTSFSLAPLRAIGILGFIIAFFAILITAYFLIESIFSERTVPGWASTVLPIYFLGAVQLISLGIISEYIGKLFLESKKRPNFIIEERIQ